MLKRALLLTIMALSMSACASPFNLEYKAAPNCSYFSETESCKSNSKRQISIFLDGTGNTEKSQTNILKLHSLITLQDKPNRYSLYVPGVGTEWHKTISGGAFGNGFDDRVKLAYHYISKHYRKNIDVQDEIYLFGFSRGAYSARVLAGLIYVADLPDFNGIEEKEEQMDLINKIYKEFKSKKSIEKKRENIHKIAGYTPKSTGVRINFMGIFDTVSALKYNYSEEFEIEYLDDKYVDQICNIDKAAHAMSIDDNRAHSFTPVLMKVSDIASQCKGLDTEEEKGRLISSVVTEVWFSGAHSDVGGGYEDSELSHVPLNWMMRQMKKNKKASSLLPENPFVYEDEYADSHIGENSLIGGRLYINRNRNLPLYAKAQHEDFPLLVLHSSVINRKARVPSMIKEFYFDPPADWRNRNYDRCFENVPLKDENIPDLEGKYKYTLKYTPNLDNPCFVIDEPERLKTMVIDEN